MTLKQRIVELIRDGSIKVRDDEARVELLEIVEEYDANSRDSHINTSRV